LLRLFGRWRTSPAKGWRSSRKRFLR
jgi:hypothetical protein